MNYSLKSVYLALSLMTSSVSVSAIGSASMERPVGSSSYSSPCGTREVSPAKAATVIEKARLFVANKEKEFGSTAYGGNINVYWNTIRSSTGQGSLSTSVINKQIQDINNAFSAGGWRFTLKSVRTHTNNAWFNIDYGEDESFKYALHQGDSHDLNIYSTALTGGTLGWATFPWDYEDNLYMDGVVVGFQTLASSGFQGDTGIHEVGHWMGLFHTFQGGCSDPNGDYVWDTPAVAEANYGCPVGIDSCPGGGIDLVRNFMDYTDDSCMNSFTNGQFESSQYCWSTWRAPGTLDRDETSRTEHEPSTSTDFMHTGFYGIIGLVGVMTIVGGVLYKKKRDQDQLDEERLSEWVGDVTDIDNPMRQSAVSSEEEVDIEFAEMASVPPSSTKIEESL